MGCLDFKYLTQEKPAKRQIGRAKEESLSPEHILYHARFREYGGKRDHYIFSNSLPFPWRLISQPRPLILFAFRSSGPHSPVPSGTSEAPSPDPVPTGARLHCPLLFLPNPRVLLLLLLLKDLSLLCSVSESLGAGVFTVPLLPLRSPSPHKLRFYLSGARVLTPRSVPTLSF